jgi:hypothetical protein
MICMGLVLIEIKPIEFHTSPLLESLYVHLS